NAPLPRRVRGFDPGMEPPDLLDLAGRQRLPHDHQQVDVAARRVVVPVGQRAEQVYAGDVLAERTENAVNEAGDDLVHVGIGRRLVVRDDHYAIRPQVSQMDTALEHPFICVVCAICGLLLSCSGRYSPGPTPTYCFGM